MIKKGGKPKPKTNTDWFRYIGCSAWFNVKDAFLEISPHARQYSQGYAPTHDIAVPAEMSILSSRSDGLGYYYGFIKDDRRQINIRDERRPGSDIAVWMAYVGGEVYRHGRR